MHSGRRARSPPGIASEISAPDSRRRSSRPSTRTSRRTVRRRSSRPTGERYLLATHGAHVFDTVRYLLGDVVAIEARHREDGRDHTWVSAPDDGVGQRSAAWRSPSTSPGSRRRASRSSESAGRCASTRPFPSTGWPRRCRPTRTRRSSSPTLTDGDAYERQLEAFAAAIRDHRPPSPDARDGLAAVTLIHAIAAAVESGDEVRL